MRTLQMPSLMVKRLLSSIIVLSCCVLLLPGCNRGSSDSSQGTGAPAPVYEEKTITPQGGTYMFADGFSLIVPEGAVESDTAVQMRKVGTNELSAVYSARGASLDTLYGGIEGKPDGLTFRRPVTLVLQAVLTPGGIPLIHQIDLANNVYAPAKTRAVADPDKGTVEFTIDHFAVYTAEDIAKMIQQGAQYCAENPCKCEEVVSELSEGETVCRSGDCQMTESSLKVTYPRCQNPGPELHIVSESSAGCVPTLALSAARTSVPINQSTAVAAEVKLGCAPLNAQEVAFSVVPALGTIDPASPIATDGTATTTFTAGSAIGTVNVSAQTTARYSALIIYASSGTGREEGSSPYITKDISSSLPISITSSPYHIIADASFPPSSYSSPTYAFSMGNYSIHLEFDLNPDFSGATEMGHYYYCDSYMAGVTHCDAPAIMASASQSYGDISIAPGPASCSASIENLSGPASFTVPLRVAVVYAKDDPSNASVRFGAESSDFRYIRHDMRRSPLVMGTCLDDVVAENWGLFGVLWYPQQAPPLAQNEGQYPLKNGTYTGTAAYTMNLLVHDVEGTSTVTIQR